VTARRPLFALLLGAALAAGGCAGAADDSAKDFRGDQRLVAEAVEDLQDAGTKGDGNKICEQLLTKELVAQIRRAGAESCADAVEDALADADAFEISVEKVAIDGARATATVKSEAGDDERMDTLTLERAGRDWRISSLGS
jgi:hypothetical protein